MLISTGKFNIVFSSTQLSAYTPHSILTPFPNFLSVQQSYSVDSSIFDKGLNLPRPEAVPFRLTPNMLDAFGPTGADGIFKSGMESSLDILRKNRDTLLSVLEPFIKDPVIDWKKQRTQSQDSRWWIQHGVDYSSYTSIQMRSLEYHMLIIIQNMSNHNLIHLIITV